MTNVANPTIVAARPESTDTSTKYIRHGIGAMRPCLYGYRDTWALVRDAFSAREIECDKFSVNSFHLEAQIGDSVVVLEISDMPHPQSFPGSVYVYVKDIDAAYSRALAAGGRSLQVPTDKSYGERQACVGDVFGNVFWIATLQDRSAQSGNPDA